MSILVEHNTHLIKSHAYEIELSDQKDAYQFQSDIISLQNSRITPLIEKVLNHFIPENYSFYIDSIELDLGVVSKYNYENELPILIEEKLIQYFKSNMLDNGTLRSAKRIEGNISTLNNLEYFLLNGYYSWQNNSEKSPSLVLKDLIKTNAIDVVSMLKKIGKKELVRKRMVYQFTEELLENIVLTVVGKENKYMISFKNYIFQQKEESNQFKRSSIHYKDAIWEVILAFVFEKTGDYTNKKTFVKYLIVHISQKYQIALESFLLQITQGIGIEKSKESPSLEFIRLIKELKGQELRINNDAKYSLNKNKINWVYEIDYFLNFGVFKSKIFIGSQKEFNNRLKLLIQEKNKDFIKQIRKWILEPSQLNRLLVYSDHHLFDELVTFCPSSSFKVIDDFILHVDNNRNRLTHDTNKLWTRIKDQRSKLTLHSFLYNPKNLSDRLPSFLMSILKEFEKEEGLIHLLINEIYLVLPNNLQDPLVNSETFVSGLLIQSEVQKIIDEINLFAYQNEKVFWELWFKNNSIEWCQRLQCTQQELIFRFEKSFSLSASKQPLQLILEEIRKKDSGILPVHSDIERINPREKHDPLVLPTSFEPVLYIIDKGELPWWIPSFSKSMMNESFSRIWKHSEKREKLISSLSKSKNCKLFYRLIEFEQIQNIWKAGHLEHNEGLDSIFMEFQNLFANKFVPIGLLKHIDYTTFISNVTSIGFNYSGSKATSKVFDYLNDWLLKVEFIKYENSGLYFYQLIDNLLNKALGPSIEKELLNTKSILKDLSNKLIKKKANKLSNSIITPKYEKDNLKMGSIASSTLNEIHKDLSQKLNSEQEDYFEKSISFIYAFKNLLSIVEFEKIRLLFSELVWLSYHSTGLKSWSKLKWNLLTFHSFSQIIGVRKSKSLIIENDQKLMSDPQIKLYQNGILEALIQDNKILLGSTVVKMGSITNGNSDFEQEIDKTKETSYNEIFENQFKEIEAFKDPIFVNNAGLIILSPFLGTLFEKSGLLQNGDFIDEQRKMKAVRLLSYAATGSIDLGEEHLIIPKILSGLAIQLPVNRSIQLNSKDKELVDSLLSSITQQWKPLENSSIDTLRESFFQRKGKLENKEDFLQLHIETKGIDILLDQIPWNIGMVKTQWMDKLLQIAWR
ncbi:contractile injection system tape measure protein [Lutimonas halocynthiae]|uniref:contractile injection system tape measure protein n=1 Tax=Lutimonas halocynthiae TaxID=1446477 RepID=UPI0025B3B435|nr:contractile injection system tape measure protein [Lutimonas halocynthiae]MDN3643353.1 contractile injection system tape measure protein [Lutimonas halocynthiae]